MGGFAQLGLLFSPARVSPPGSVRCSSGRAGRPPVFLGVRGWRCAGFQLRLLQPGWRAVLLRSNPGLRVLVRVQLAARASACAVTIPSPGWLSFEIVLPGGPWLSRAQEGGGGWFPRCTSSSPPDSGFSSSPLSSSPRLPRCSIRDLPSWTPPGCRPTTGQRES
jgi:hypothetical protein